MNFKQNVTQYVVYVVTSHGEKMLERKKQNKKVPVKDKFQYTMYPSTARGSSLAVNDQTMDVRLTSDRPSTP